MDQNQVIIGAVAVVALAVAAYFLLFANKPVEATPNVLLYIQPTMTTQFPSKTCFIGAEPTYPQGAGSRISFTAAFYITNIGKQPLDYPASIYLIFNDVLAGEYPLTKPYSSGAMVYDGKKEFSFVQEFMGMQFTPEKVYKENVDFEYKLVYCPSPCTDPLSQSQVVYTNSTRYCCRLPSTAIGGGIQSPCGSS